MGRLAVSPEVVSDAQEAVEAVAAESSVPYSGIPSDEIELVWNVAVRLPWHREPDRLIRTSKTKISRDAALAIMIATRCLRPQFPKEVYDLQQTRIFFSQPRPPRLYDSDDSKKFIRYFTQFRQESQWQPLERDSVRYERLFIAEVRRVFPDMIDQAEQLRSLEIDFALGKPRHNVTPDILFPKPKMFFGKMCSWVDYKNALGFSFSPKSYLRERNHAENYSAVYGPGMFVYRHGYEEGLFDNEGVACAREAEVLQWLAQE